MRLEFEATLLARLQSPWLPRVLHVGHEGDDLLVVYSYVPGAPLKERLDSRPLSVTESLVVATAMFSALREMHGQQLLHRGVGPSNVIVNAEGPIATGTLVEFEPSASLYVEGNRLRQQTLDAALYLSPEQAGSIDHDVTEASDLYAAGVALFHCLAGRPPFSGNTLGAILFEHMTSCVPDLRHDGNCRASMLSTNWSAACWRTDVTATNRPKECWPTWTSLPKPWPMTKPSRPS